MHCALDYIATNDGRAIIERCIACTPRSWFLSRVRRGDGDVLHQQDEADKIQEETPSSDETVQANISYASRQGRHLSVGLGPFGVEQRVAEEAAIAIKPIAEIPPFEYHLQRRQRLRSREAVKDGFDDVVGSIQGFIRKQPVQRGQEQLPSETQGCPIGHVPTSAARDAAQVRLWGSCRRQI